MLLRKGILIGLALNVGVGSIGLLCMRITFQKGFLHGWFATMGMTTADAIYTIIFLFAISRVHSFLLPIKGVMMIFAGVFLTGLGIYQIFISPPSYHFGTEDIQPRSIVGDYFGILTMTLIHPGAMIVYLAVLSVMTIPHQNHRWAYVRMILGVIIGSSLRWTPVMGACGVIKQKGSKKLIYYLSQVASIVILLMGLWLLVDRFYLHLM